MAAAKPAAAAAGGKSAASAASASEAAPSARSVAADISAVRTHGGEHAAHGMDAHAFAAGNDVHFADAGKLHTAAHEAAHVVQQRAGSVRP